MIDLIIIDDHVLVRKGIGELLANQPDFRVVAEAGSYKEAIECIDAHRADVVIVDLSMPGRDGFDLIAHIRATRPRTHVIALTVHTEDEYASRALRGGSRGYITKDAPPEQLITAVRQVAAGSPFISPGIAQSLALRLTRHNDNAPLHQRLSRREFAIFGMLVDGKTVTGIARELDLSVKTVSAHKMSMLRKLNLHSQSELMRYAMEHRVSLKV